MPDDQERLLAELAEIQALMNRAHETTAHMQQAMEEAAERMRKL